MGAYQAKQLAEARTQNIHLTTERDILAKRCEELRLAAKGALESRDKAVAALKSKELDITSVIPRRLCSAAQPPAISPATLGTARCDGRVACPDCFPAGSGRKYPDGMSDRDADDWRTCETCKGEALVVPEEGPYRAMFGEYWVSEGVEGWATTLEASLAKDFSTRKAAEAIVVKLSKKWTASGRVVAWSTQRRG